MLVYSFDVWTNLIAFFKARIMIMIEDFIWYIYRIQPYCRLSRTIHLGEMKFWQSVLCQSAVRTSQKRFSQQRRNWVEEHSLAQCCPQAAPPHCAIQSASTGRIAPITPGQSRLLILSKLYYKNYYCFFT